jgi:hypothetical protein
MPLTIWIRSRYYSCGDTKLLQNGHCSKVPLELNLIANRIARDNGLLSLSVPIHEV